MRLRQHTTHLASLHVQAHGVLALGVGRAELGHKLLAVKAGVVGDDGGQLEQRVGKGLHGRCLLAGRAARQVLDGRGHQHLRAAWEGGAGGREGGG